MNDLDLDCLDYTTALDDDRIYVYDPSRTWGDHLTAEEMEKFKKNHNLTGWKMRK